MSTSRGFIYIVEDDRPFRKSIERLVRALGYETVSFDSANAFLTQDSLNHPACLLLDVRLPDADGLSVQKELREKGYNLPVILMTGHGNIPMGVQAMKDGAVDFLPKPFAKKELLSAIDRAIERDLQNLKEELQKKQINALLNTLTLREREIMRWVITGKLNKQIAHATGITEKTVKVHRSRVMEKTKVSSVAELVRLAEKANITPAE